MKKLAIFCLIFCMSIMGISCKQNTINQDSNGTIIEDGYTFEVLLSDNSSAVGYRVLLCVEGSCSMPQTADEYGIVRYSSTLLPGDGKAGEYDIHIMSPNWSDSTYLDYIGQEKTVESQWGTSVIQLILKHN